MFIVETEKKPIRWPVVVNVPDDDGKTKKFEFTGTFKRLSDDARDQLAADIDQDEPVAQDSDAAGAWKEGAVVNIMRIMTGWSGVVDPDKNPIPFSVEAVRAAVRGPDGLAVLRGINAAINEITQGARTKNS